jgi:hypothetical protein
MQAGLSFNGALFPVLVIIIYFIKKSNINEALQ